MAGWIDLAPHLPGLRGGRVHVLPSSQEGRLLLALRSTGFEVRLLEGGRIRDEPSFFAEAERALGLPSHFGRNWDALNDSLGEMCAAGARPLAVVWRDAELSLACDLQTVLGAVLALDAAASVVPAQDGAEPVQLEVFLLGGGPGFGH